MSEPICRVCYASTLSRDELDRFTYEPVTNCIYLCPDHQRAASAMLEMMPVPFIKASPITYNFPQAE